MMVSMREVAKGKIVKVAVVVISGLIFGAILIGIDLAKENRSKHKEKIPTTLDGKVKYIVSKSGGSSISVQLDSIIMEQGGFLADIEYTAQDRKLSMLFRGMDIMKAIYTDPHLKAINTCMLRPHMTFINNYGKEEIVQTAKIVLYRKTAVKLAWKNLTPQMFTEILQNEGQLWLHPGLK